MKTKDSGMLLKYGQTLAEREDDNTSIAHGRIKRNEKVFKVEKVINLYHGTISLSSTSPLMCPPLIIYCEPYPQVSEKEGMDGREERELRKLRVHNSKENRIRETFQIFEKEYISHLKIFPEEVS